MLAWLPGAAAAEADGLVSTLPADDQGNLTGPIGQTFVVPAGRGGLLEAVTLGGVPVVRPSNREEGWLDPFRLVLRVDNDGNPKTWDPGEVLAESGECALPSGNEREKRVDFGAAARVEGGKVYALEVVAADGGVANRRLGFAGANQREDWFLFANRAMAYGGRVDLAMRLEIAASGEAAALSSLPAVDSANFGGEVGQTFRLTSPAEVVGVEVAGGKPIGGLQSEYMKPVRVELYQDRDGVAESWDLGRRLAVSGAAELRWGDEPTRFLFGSGVALRAGTVYVLRFVGEDGQAAAVRVGLGVDSPLLGGHLFRDGRPMYEGRLDLGFRLCLAERGRGSGATAGGGDVGRRGAAVAGGDGVELEGMKLRLRRVGDAK